jgi:hypothetical protein
VDSSGSYAGLVCARCWLGTGACGGSSAVDAGAASGKAVSRGRAASDGCADRSAAPRPASATVVPDPAPRGLAGGTATGRPASIVAASRVRGRPSAWPVPACGAASAAARSLCRQAPGEGEGDSASVTTPSTSGNDDAGEVRASTRWPAVLV